MIPFETREQLADIVAECARTGKGVRCYHLLSGFQLEIHPQVLPVPDKPVPPVQPRRGKGAEKYEWLRRKSAYETAYEKYRIQAETWQRYNTLISEIKRSPKYLWEVR